MSKAPDVAHKGDSGSGSTDPAPSYCFDIDGTLCITSGTDYAAAVALPDAIASVNRLYDRGHRILLYTARGTRTGIDWRDLAVQQLAQWGVRYHELHLGKPAADVFIDDRAISAEDWMRNGHGNNPNRMTASVEIAGRKIGEGEPVFIVAELGINHNGSMTICRKLMEAAAAAGCDAVKFQKRTPELCVPESQRSVLRETPWGLISYLEYRERVEFDRSEYEQIDQWAKQLGLIWFTSVWDIPSVDFMERFDPPCYKIASATVTDHDLLERVAATGRPVVLSTGMSTLEEIDQAVEILDRSKLLVAHTTSTYPCPVNELNLRMIPVLKARYQVPVGYSGHEVGLATSWAAVTLGATFLERHVTLDRAMWGSDQAASVEPGGMQRLVANVRDIEAALGDGHKRVYESERPAKERLRRQPSTSA